MVLLPQLLIRWNNENKTAQPKVRKQSWIVPVLYRSVALQWNSLLFCILDFMCVICRCWQLGHNLSHSRLIYERVTFHGKLIYVWVLFQISSRTYISTKTKLEYPCGHTCLQLTIFIQTTMVWMHAPWDFKNCIPRCIYFALFILIMHQYVIFWHLR